MNFVDTMRKALAGEITVRTWWGCSGLTGDGFRQWFRERLDARINRHDRRQWRRLSDDYQASLARDANRDFSPNTTVGIAWTNPFCS